MDLPTSGPKSPPVKPAGLWRNSFLVSAVIHVLVLALLIWVPYQLWFAAPAAGPNGAAPVGGGGGAAHSGLPKKTPRLASVNPADIKPEVVQQRLDTLLQRAAQNTPEENEAQLARAAEKLNTVSSEKSVDELAQNFKQWMGTQQRATAPAKEPVPGQFDYQSAQLHDVERSRDANGRWQYQVIMLDKAGRTEPTPVSVSEGEQLYRTFQLLKKNPLADQIYRKMAMPLFDKLLEKKQTPPANPSEPAPQAVEP